MCTPVKHDVEDKCADLAGASRDEREEARQWFDVDVARSHLVRRYKRYGRISLNVVPGSAAYDVILKGIGELDARQQGS